MSVFFFINKDSFLHRMDPRVKITGLILFCMLAVAGESILQLGLMLVVLLSLFLFSKSGVNLKKWPAFSC